MSAAVREWELTFTAKRWRWWPEAWPLGLRTSTWCKTTSRAEVELFAQNFRELGAKNVAVTLAGCPPPESSQAE